MGLALSAHPGCLLPALLAPLRHRQGVAVPPTAGLARASMDGGVALNVAALRAAAKGNHGDSFYDPVSAADAAAAAAAAAVLGTSPGSQQGAGHSRRSVRLPGSAADVAGDALAPPPSYTATSLVLDGEEEVEMLFDRLGSGDGETGEADFEVKWRHSLEGVERVAGHSPPGEPAAEETAWTAEALQRQLAAASADGAPASQAAAALVRRQASGVAASRAAAAGAGSARDLLGRLHTPIRWAAGSSASSTICCGTGRAVACFGAPGCSLLPAAGALL